MRRKVARATIKEVAAEAGVSTQTVSRVINERPDVSPETRRRVLGVIERLDYQPSALARSLIRRRSSTLGVVTAGLRFIGPSRTLSGISAAAEEAGYSLLLKELPRYDEDNIEPTFRELLSRHVDGIIWAVPEIGGNHKWVPKVPVDLDIPIVYLTMKPRKDISVVSIDNYEGGRLATSHLLEQGYRRIGHISGPLDWWESRQRMAAWKDVLREAGMKVRERQWTEGDWSSYSGAQAVELLFRQYPEMDSIFVANDQMSLGAMRVIQSRGRRIPDDIGVVGFDDIPETECFLPSLSTVHQDQYETAQVAVGEIIKIIESGWRESGPIRPKSILLAPTLVVRESSVLLKRQTIEEVILEKG